MRSNLCNKNKKCNEKALKWEKVIKSEFNSLVDGGQQSRAAESSKTSENECMKQQTKKIYAT